MLNPSADREVNNNYRLSTEKARQWWASQGFESRKNIVIESDAVINDDELVEDQTVADIADKDYDELPDVTKQEVDAQIDDEEDVEEIFDVEGEEYLQCSTCDDMFTSNEDYEFHKSIDHGEEPEDFEESEETYQLTMHPELTRESLREANNLLTETEERQLYSGYDKNGNVQSSVMPYNVPSVATGKYNDNPNEFFYSNKIFRAGSSSLRTSSLGENVNDEIERIQFDTDSAGQFEESPYFCKDCEDMGMQDAMSASYASKHLQDNPTHNIEKQDGYESKVKAREWQLPAELQGLIPDSGSVNDPDLEELRKAMNTYYEVSNNGGGNWYEGADADTTSLMRNYNLSNTERLEAFHVDNHENPYDEDGYDIEIDQNEEDRLMNSSLSELESLINQLIEKAKGKRNENNWNAWESKASEGSIECPNCDGVGYFSTTADKCERCDGKGTISDWERNDPETGEPVPVGYSWTPDGAVKNESKATEFSLRDYEKNEDINYHAENALQLVKKYGTQSEIDAITKINKNHMEVGHLVYEDSIKRGEISNKYFDRLLADATEEERKSYRGESNLKAMKDSGAGDMVGEIPDGMDINEWLGEADKVEYEQVEYEDDGVSDISVPNVEPKGEDKNEFLDDVDNTVEEVNFVYPTKSTESTKSYITESEPFEEEYEEFEDSDDEIIEETISIRKLTGYSDNSIAQELHINYGVSHEEALEKVYNVEVSTNDRVAQTFFGKMYKECTESEKDELRMYSGSD